MCDMKQLYFAAALCAPGIGGPKGYTHAGAD